MRPNLLAALEGARRAAVLLRPHSGLIPEQADFDATKLARLSGILQTAFPALSTERIQEIVTAARWAAIDLVLMRDHTDKGGMPKRRIDLCDVLNKLEVLAEAARGLAQAWSAATSDPYLSGSLKTHLRRREGSSAGNRDALEDALTRRAWASRLDEVLTNDLWRLVAELRPFYEAISGAGRFKLAEHLCVYQIARAWRECSGKAPTLTRNLDAVAGPQASAFQRFMAEAVPPPTISERIMRDAVGALGT